MLILFVGFTDDLANDEGSDVEDDEPGWTPEDEEEFRTEMDKDGDGKLNRDEIYKWLVPDDYDHILDESNHLFSEADDDKVCLFSVAELEFCCCNSSFRSRIQYVDSRLTVTTSKKFKTPVKIFTDKVVRCLLHDRRLRRIKNGIAG